MQIIMNDGPLLFKFICKYLNITRGIMKIYQRINYNWRKLYIARTVTKEHIRHRINYLQGKSELKNETRFFEASCPYIHFFEKMKNVFKVHGDPDKKMRFLLNIVVCIFMIWTQNRSPKCDQKPSFLAF